MKVVRLADAFEYPVTGHLDMRALRLHNKETSNTVDYTLGLSHFLPGGGTEYVETGVELIYFILEGEMTVRTKDETIVLKKYDSIHFNVGDGKEIRNETNLTEKERKEIEDKVEQEVQAACKFAAESPYPEASELMDDIFCD